jgi:hypothetical protein
MDDSRWDHGLKVTGEEDGLAAHAGAVLLRKLADQAGLTAALGSALARAGKFPLIDRGVALVSMAVAIVLGATSMNDIALLAHHEPLFGAPPSDTTVRRALELADPGTLDKVARVRAAVRDQVWSLICMTPAGFPWLQTAGRLAGHRPGRHADHRAQTRKAQHPRSRKATASTRSGPGWPIPPSRWRSCVFFRLGQGSAAACQPLDGAAQVAVEHHGAVQGAERVARVGQQFRHQVGVVEDALLGRGRDVS